MASFIPLVLATVIVIVLVLAVLARFVPFVQGQLYYHGLRARTFAAFVWEALFLRLERLFRSDTEPRAGDTSISASWLTSVLQARNVIDAQTQVATVELSADGLNRGFVGEMSRLTVTYTKDDADAPRTFVMKCQPAGYDRAFTSVLLGSCREAQFYHKAMTSSALVGDEHYVPTVFHASWNNLTGRYLMIMEDLRGQGNCLEILGNQCWGPPPPPADDLPTQEVLLTQMVLKAAAMHAKHWNNAKLLRQGWLRCCDLFQGNNRGRYEVATAGIIKKWSVFKDATINGQLKGKVTLPAKLVEVMDKAIKVSTWETFQAEYNVHALPFTLCHGDHHAANQMWRRGVPVEEALLMLDWAEVGINHGATDISQYMISNVTIDVRRKLEMKLVRSYYARLVASGKVNGSEYPFTMCWERYVRGGIDRWLQMVTLMGYVAAVTPQRLPAFAMQWFVNQVAAFIEDHAEADKVYHLAYVYCFQ